MMESLIMFQDGGVGIGGAGGSIVSSNSSAVMNATDLYQEQIVLKRFWLLMTRPLPNCVPRFDALDEFESKTTFHQFSTILHYDASKIANGTMLVS